MAKELPYFKFEPSAWDNGNIQLCSWEEKGIFISVCSMYWQRLGDMPYKLAVQKICNGNATALDSLIEEKVIKVFEGQIRIDFLDEQLSEFDSISNKNSENARLGWKKRRFNATAKRPQSDRNAIREEKRRGEEIRGDDKSREEKNFEWFKKQIDEIWFDQLPSEKKENVPRALQEAWAHLSADELRLHNAGSKECKQLLNTWLSRMKSENTNGTIKIINDKLKSDALIKQKFAAKAAVGGGNAN